MSLKHVILSILAEGPATGYDMVKRFDAVSGYFWNASHQQIYRDLKGMEASGWVAHEGIEQQGKPDKKLYRLTADGDAELDSWMNRDSEVRVNNAFLVKLSAAARTDPGKLLPLLDRQATVHRARLDHYLAIANQIGDPGGEFASLLDWLALRRGIRGEEDWLGWIDEARRMLAAREAS